tara:strand:+ start:29 stop:409 length:381 start_codon:yes stop_codon:yes gene_type:complete
MKPTNKVPITKTVAMPKDTNANGDIFGGWLMGQMDLAGAIIARDYAKGRIATVAVDAMSFIAPVKIGDIVSCFGSVIKLGKTSITVKIEVTAARGHEEDIHLVTNGTFVYVAIDKLGKPRKILQSN